MRAFIMPEEEKFQKLEFRSEIFVSKWGKDESKPFHLNSSRVGSLKATSLTYLTSGVTPRFYSLSQRSFGRGERRSLGHCTFRQCYVICKDNIGAKCTNIVSRFNALITFILRLPFHC